MSEVLRILKTIDTAREPYGVVKVIGVENSIQVSRGSDGISILVTRGSAFAAITLTDAEVAHFVQTILDLIPDPAPGRADKATAA